MSSKVIKLKSSDGKIFETTWKCALMCHTIKVNNLIKKANSLLQYFAFIQGHDGCNAWKLRIRIGNSFAERLDNSLRDGRQMD